jgi:hypothetical protein
MRRSAATQHVADKDQPREPWSCAVGVEARACFACQVAAERGRAVAGSCMAGQRARLRPPVSNLSARVPRIALPGTASPRLPYRLSCGDVVRRIARDSGVWVPHSLHTAEVTGSIPVTPTSTNGFSGSLWAPFASRALLAGEWL